MCGFCRGSERAKETTIVNRSEVEAKHGRSRRRRSRTPSPKSSRPHWLTNWLPPFACPPTPQALTRDVKSTTTCRTWIWVGWPPPPPLPPLHPSPWTFGPSIFYKHPNWRCRSFVLWLQKHGNPNPVICSCDMTLNLWTF